MTAGHRSLVRYSPFPGFPFSGWVASFWILFVFSHRGAFHASEIVDSFEARVYVNRITGGDCDHRCSGCLTASGSATGA
jgi:hypothetical protein